MMFVSIKCFATKVFVRFFLSLCGFIKLCSIRAQLICIRELKFGTPREVFIKFVVFLIGSYSF